MILTIDIPDSVVDEAKARGISVEALVREKIEVTPSAAAFVSPTAKRFGPGTKTPKEAAESIREMRKRYTLGGSVTIKELIEEGRRY